MNEIIVRLTELILRLELWKPELSPTQKFRSLATGFELCAGAKEDLHKARRSLNHARECFGIGED